MNLKTIYALLSSFDEIYDKMDRQERRSLIKYLIAEVQLYTSDERKEKAHFCKSITYRFPIEQAVLDDFSDNGVRVETVCQLVLRKPVVHVNIDVDAEELVQDKRGLATYEQIKAHVLEHTGLKVSSLYIAQVKQKCGIIERENYNKPKNGDAKQPQCPPEKEAAIMEALRRFGMI